MNRLQERFNALHEDEKRNTVKKSFESRFPKTIEELRDTLAKYTHLGIKVCHVKHGEKWVVYSSCAQTDKDGNDYIKSQCLYSVEYVEPWRV